jgi:hypothetical protein
MTANGPIDDSGLKVFLFQLALVQAFAPSLRKAFWSDVESKRVGHLNQRFGKGMLFSLYESPEVTKMGSTVYIDFASESIIVNFPGTNDQTQVDMYATIRETKMPWAPKYKAQRGFLALYMTVRDATKADLRRAIDEFPGYKLIFNGWSLGGACSRLAAWDFLSDPSMFQPYFTALIDDKRRARENVYVFTWGSPKPFTKKSAAAYTERFIGKYLFDYRFETKNDIVPRLPPDWANFHHTGERFEVPNRLVSDNDTWVAGFTNRHLGYSQNTQQMIDYYDQYTKEQMVESINAEMKEDVENKNASINT